MPVTPRKLNFRDNDLIFDPPILEPVVEDVYGQGISYNEVFDNSTPEWRSQAGDRDGRTFVNMGVVSYRLRQGVSFTLTTAPQTISNPKLDRFELWVNNQGPVPCTIAFIVSNATVMSVNLPQFYAIRLRGYQDQLQGSVATAQATVVSVMEF